MSAPNPEHIEAVRAIGVQHRSTSVSVVRDSVTCACGHESTNHDGLEEHRATLIVETLMTDAAMLDALTRHGVLGWKYRMWTRPPERRLVTPWEVAP